MRVAFWVLLALATVEAIVLDHTRALLERVALSNAECQSVVRSLAASEALRPPEEGSDL